MNPTPDHLDDETLSILLDGAADDQRHAAVHLAGCGHCAGRQAALGAARAALATAAVERLDDLTRRRLVAAALRAADDGPLFAPGDPVPGRTAGRGRWLQRHPALIGSVAAVLLGLLVGVPFVVGNDGGDSERTLSAQAPAELRDESAGAFLGDLGDLADRESLRVRLSGQVTAGDTFAYAPAEPGPSPAAGGGSGAPLPAAAPAAGGLAGSSARSASPPSTAVSTTAGGAEKAVTGAPAADATSNADQLSREQASGADADRDRADTEACVAALLEGPARGGRLLRSGVGTYRGRPAVVASFELEGGTVAFVADRSGCAVLDRFPM